MINATLTLTRTGSDDGEMYRKYFIVADFGSRRGQGASSIIPLSAGAPMPSSEHLCVQGGEDEALLGAIEALKALDGNAGFSAAINLEPD